VFIKLTRRGPNHYVQLVHAYRDASTGKPKQRTVASLGRLDQLNTELHSVIAGLQRVTGQTPMAPAVPLAPPSLSFDAARGTSKQQVSSMRLTNPASGTFCHFHGLRRVVRTTPKTYGGPAKAIWRHW